MTDTVVTLDHWQCPVYGDRWTLMFEGRPRITAPTEAEARREAERNGWTIDEGDGLMLEDG